ncbi:hypothetical protein QFC22_004344 [Naganishia vaughanmartiniae]|uniref:Uncharacterized protein n=1 Tax=Naganishia vaughanmartiniae TaxID=1424756 RepID=A0ACC2X2D8_9TREE|nr:hypothetical protein QFC22_004344 [Naganishia vaughanmartiniae]
MEEQHGQKAEPLPLSVPDTGSIDPFAQITEDDSHDASTDDQPTLRHPSVLKRQRSDSYDYEAIYRSLPASPTTVAETPHGQADGPLEDTSNSALLPSTADSDGSLVTTSTAQIERTQRAHSQPFGFTEGTGSEEGHPAKKRRLFQHEHQLDTTNGAEEKPSNDHEPVAETTDVDAAEDHDLITAQLMASLQQAAEDPEYATTTLAQAEADQAQHLTATVSPTRDGGESITTEHHEHEPELDTFPHDDIINAFMSASTEASPKVPSMPEPYMAAESTEDDTAEDKVASRADSSPVTTSMSPGQRKSPVAPAVIDPSLNKLAPRLGASPRPVQVVPSLRPVTLPMNPRPVPTTVVPMANGSSRPLLGASSPRTPTLSNSRPVMVTAFTSSGPQLVRPIPKKTLPRDFTPSRLTDKRRPTPRKLSGRGSGSTPPMPNPYDLAAKNSIVVKPAVEEPDITSTLSTETLAVLEAAATSLSQIQGPVTQEHLEAIVLQLTNAGIDLSQLGLGNLVAQDEDDDTTNQFNSRADNQMDMSGNTIFGDGGSQSFHDMHDSQPDDMNLQAQSLIAALSALVPQSQPAAEPHRPVNIAVAAPAPITIDLTDEPDEEPSAAIKPVTGAETTSAINEATLSPKSPNIDESKTSEPNTSADPDAQVTELSDELREEKTRITSLNATSRIEELEAMIRELEHDSAATPLDIPASKDATEKGDKSEAEMIPVVAQPDQELTAESDKDRPAAGEAESPSKPASPRVETSTLDAEKAKERTSKLALYRDLLSVAKAESAPANVEMTAGKDTDQFRRTLNSPGKVSQALDEATSTLAMLSSPAASSKPTKTTIADTQGGTSIPVDKDNLPHEPTARVDSPLSPNATLASTETANKEKPDAQALETPVQGPIFVKSEPIDFDFTAATLASNPPAPADSTGQTADGADVDNHGAEPSTYPNEDDQVLQPAETSMEEDPLLAELFPTFPMGGSPAQANHMQAEEESDPMLAGMLQELDASNGHSDMNYDSSHGNDFTGAWNPWAEVPHVIPETSVIPILIVTLRRTKCRAVIQTVSYKFPLLSTWIQIPTKSISD